MELSTDNTSSLFPRLGLKKRGQSITTLVHVKPTNIGLLVHYNSHIDNGYNKFFIAKLDEAFNLSSNWPLLHEECIGLKTLFLQFSHPEHVIHSMISKFITSKQTPAPPRKSTPDLQSVRIVLPFKEQKSADSVCKQWKNLGNLL